MDGDGHDQTYCMKIAYSNLVECVEQDNDNKAIEFI